MNDNSTVQYQMWDKGQPNGGENENGLPGNDNEPLVGDTPRDPPRDPGKALQRATLLPMPIALTLPPWAAPRGFSAPTLSFTAGQPRKVWQPFERRPWARRTSA